MNWVCDPPVQIGACTIVTVSRLETKAYAIGAAVGASGTKTPAAVIIEHAENQHIYCLDPDLSKQDLDKALTSLSLLSASLKRAHSF